MKKSYFIDFDSWVIIAESYEEAEKKARKYITSGKVPNISGLDIAEDNPKNFADECYDYIQLEVTPCKTQRD